MENIYLEQAKLKIKPLKIAMTDALAWHQQSQKIVFTNGCFDLVHRGHIEFLSLAASMGDRLIIGLNSDSSVRLLKGKNRPINKEEDRAILLASMYWVDAIVVFEEETPLNLIRTLMPDVLAKGGDYRIEDIVGADDVIQSGGKVFSLPFLDRYSSSGIIEKIQRKDDDD